MKIDALGDFLIALPLLQAYRETYARERIILVGNPAWLSLAKDLSTADEYIAVEFKRYRKDLGYRRQLNRQLRRTGALQAVNLSYSRSFEVDDALIRATAARSRVGFEGDVSNSLPWKKRISDFWYTRRIHTSGGTTEVERQEAMARALDLVKGAGYGPLRSLADRSGPAARCPAFDYILFPGAGWAPRQWPAARFAEVAGWLRQSHGLEGIVVGRKEERDLVQSIVRLAGLDPARGVLGLALPQIAHLVAKATFVFGNESGGLHLAAALGVPSLSILGGGHYGRFMPYPQSFGAGRAPATVAKQMECFGCNWECRYALEGGAVRCIAAVDVASVKHALADIL